MHNILKHTVVRVSVELMFGFVTNYFQKATKSEFKLNCVNIRMGIITKCSFLHFVIIHIQRIFTQLYGNIVSISPPTLEQSFFMIEKWNC